MKVYSDLENMELTAESNISIRIKIPDDATAKQVSEFYKTAKNVIHDPTPLISDAFEKIFDQPFDDGTEYAPNEEESEIVDHHGMTS